jgi:hypothetical protein
VRESAKGWSVLEGIIGMQSSSPRRIADLIFFWLCLRKRSTTILNQWIVQYQLANNSSQTDIGEKLRDELQELKTPLLNLKGRGRIYVRTSQSATLGGCSIAMLKIDTSILVHKVLVGRLQQAKAGSLNIGAALHQLLNNRSLGTVRMKHFIFQKLEA